MTDSSSLSSSAAGRYATALFDLASDANALDRTERDMAALGNALEASDDQSRAIAAVAKAMGLSELVSNLIGLMASKRRLFVLDEVIGLFARLMAEHRGEVTAEVTSARELSGVQRDSLTATLKKAIGREVKLNVTVDEKIIGGLVVKLGSKMIDTSIRSKLASLQNAMREVG